MNKLNEPILPGTAATDYERYLRTDELLALQKTRGEVVHRDEHLFQTVHQSSELWLKLACIEIADAIALVNDDRTHAAVRLLRRANDALSIVTTELGMLEHLSPNDYAIVRTALGHGAGFDSPGFRQVHHVSPDLGLAFQRLLERRGLTIFDVYARGYELEDVYQLAEQMMTWDSGAVGWRFHHLKIVERIIGGNVIGTQGTPVDVLGKRIDVRFYPELWSVRDEITARSELGADGHGQRTVDHADEKDPGAV
jgi:tryptophan 2,3-dioxygenase